MNITCKKENLLKALTISINSVSERTTVKALKCFKIESNKNYITITANNLETNIICKIPATVNENGKTLVHAKTFYNIVSKLPDGDVSFYLSENQTLLIRSGNSTFNIYTTNSEEFPEDMKIDNYNEINFNKDIFKDLIKRVAFSASDDEGKVILNGVLIDIDDKNSKITFVAADGYRLAKDEIKFKTDISLTTIIPIKTINEVNNILNSINIESFKIKIEQSKLLFECGDIQIFSRLINGKYPDYKQLIPKEKNLQIKVNRKDLLDGSERVNIIAQKNSFMVKLEIIEDSLLISSVTPDFGDGSEKIAVKYEGDNNIQVVFNVKLMIEALKNMDSENIYLEIVSDEKPILVKEDNNEDYIYIMMPIKIKR